MAEEQQHGFAFQEFVRETAANIKGSAAAFTDYTGKWDMLAVDNPDSAGGPISIKTAQWNSGIGFGDVLRQFSLQETFTLVVGFWQWQRGIKKVVKVVVITVVPEVWRSLWCPIEVRDLLLLNEVVKDMTQTPQAARHAAQAIVSRPPFTQAVFTVNRKIDSKQQRRVQCSLSQAKLFTRLARDVSMEMDAEPELWGRPAALSLPGKKRFGAV